jgi:dihydroneopterin aldolase
MPTAEFRITRLAIHGRHGARAEEQSLGQRFFLDLAITAEVGNALASDRVEDTLHYGQVIKAATAAFNARTFNLIEAAAAAVADDLLAKFPAIVKIRVTVHKPSAPVSAIIDDLSATVKRKRGDGRAA